MVIIVLACIALIGIVYVFSQPAQTTTVYTVHPHDLMTSLLVNGTYTVAAQTPVTSPTNGTITELFVQNNTVVKKGDQLFHIESSATADQQKKAYADYLAAQSVVNADKADAYTLQSLMFSKWDTFFHLATNSTYQNGDGSPNTTNRILPEFTTAQDDWLASEARYKNQQGVLAKDQAALASALLTYNETKSVTVTAPAAGTVTNLTAQIGDQVEAAATRPVLLITDFSNPVIVSDIDQDNIPHLAVGQQAQIVFDALPDQTYSGYVSVIDANGTKVQGTVTFRTIITLSHVSPQMHPNMTATITIETAKRVGVLTVPNDALTHTNGHWYVQRTHTNARSLVTIGVQGTTSTEITGGLRDGDTITIPQ